MPDLLEDVGVGFDESAKGMLWFGAACYPPRNQETGCGAVRLLKLASDEPQHYFQHQFERRVAPDVETMKVC